MMIKTIAFDLGGVIVTIDHDEALRRFREIGVADADQVLNPYAQAGIFGDLERGRISEEDFCRKLSRQVGKTLTWEECRYAWMGYIREVPQRNLDLLERLRSRGYRLILASNTNGFIQQWADSEGFSAAGLPLSHYFDRMYRSYEMEEMKPSDRFFHHILSHERTLPSTMLFIDDGARNCVTASELGMRTLCPDNGSNWTGMLEQYLSDSCG